MSRHVFVLDITRHSGLTQSLISSAQAYLSPFNPAVQEWFALPAQVPFLRDSQVHKVEVVGSQLWPSIQRRISDLASDGHADAVFHVLSFDKAVLMSAAALNGPNLTVSTYSLSMMRGGTTGSPIVRSRVGFSSSERGNRMTVSEGVELAKRALSARSHDSRERSLYVSALRPLLVQFDERARKQPLDPTSLRLISDITRIGRTEGWLSQEGVPPGVRIWLEPEKLKPIVTASAMSETKQARKPVQVSGNEQPLDSGRQRTQVMIACLKKARIYSPKSVRDLVFSALRTLIDQGQLFPLAASQLVRRARNDAQKSAENAKVAFDYWPVAGEAILELLISAGVLVGVNGAVVKPGLHARGTLVERLNPDFENECELYMLKFLIAKVGDVTKHDRTSLAHALLKVSRAEKSLDDMLDRVDEMFARLGDEIEETPDGKLKLADGITV